MRREAIFEFMDKIDHNIRQQLVVEVDWKLQRASDISFPLNIAEVESPSMFVYILYAK